MKWLPTTRVVRLFKLLPVPLLVLIVLWGTISFTLASLLLTDTTEERSTPTLSNRRLKTLVSNRSGQTVQLRLHIVGPGRAREWAPERIRRFHFVNEMKYRTDFSEPGSPPFSENRSLERYRSLLISSPGGENLRLSRGITEILNRIGSSDTLLPLGQEGYPVGPIQPEKLTKEEQSQLMDFIEGTSDKTKPVKKIIRYISPLEDQSFTLYHRIRNGRLTTSLPDKFDDVTGLERNVLLQTPVLPEMYLPDRKIGDHPDHSERFTIAGFDRYVKSFFQTELQGSVKLFVNSADEDKITYSGSGSFNMFHPSKNLQIGEITVDRITLSHNPDKKLITGAELNGRIAVSTLPPEHVLRRIQFLRTPEFRISYTSQRSNDD